MLWTTHREKIQEASLGTLISYISVCMESPVHLNENPNTTQEGFFLKNILIVGAGT